MGDKEFINKKKEEELKKEDELERRIKEMKKERIKSRRRMPRNQPTRKIIRYVFHIYFVGLISLMVSPQERNIQMFWLKEERKSKKHQVFMRETVWAL